MDKETLTRVHRALPRGRTLFHYIDDRDALLLLGWVAGDGVAVADLKRSRYARLLARPGVKPLLATLGDGILRAADVEHWWPYRPWTYRVGFGRWPLRGERWQRDYHQMTRPGHNLVVRLDFVQSHNRITRDLVGDDVRSAMWRMHPVAPGDPTAAAGPLTLGWARVDLDLEEREALVEEVQSDWVGVAREPCTCEGEGCEGDGWKRYHCRLFETYCKTWAQVVLAATLQQLIESLGIRRIFMHTPDTGTRMKGMDRTWTAPRSLYTDLPKRFCFQPTHCPPMFLKRTRGRRLRRTLIEPDTRWHVLQL